MQERSALREFEVRGMWWLPEDRQNAVPGLLRFRPGHMVFLKIDRPLHSLWKEAKPGVEELRFEVVAREVICGEGVDGTRWTLLEASELGTTFVARCLVAGAHFSREADALFESATICLTELEEWTGVSPLARAFQGPLLIPPFLFKGGDPKDPFAINVAYRELNLLDVEIPSRGCRVGIISRANVGGGYQSMTVVHAAHIVVRPSAPQGLSWYMRFFTDCARLFSFFVGSAVYRTQTLLSPRPVGAGSEPIDPVELYDNQEVEGEEEQRTRGMPFSFYGVKDKAPQVFENWFRTAEDMGPAYQFIVETLPPNDTEVVTVLLRLSQALELFFRIFASQVGGQTYVTEGEYEKRYYKPMLDAVPVGETVEPSKLALRERLRSYLKYGNEYSLKSKVERLLEWLPDEARGPLNVTDPGKFAQLTANTRNLLTHHGDSREPMAKNAREIYELNGRLRGLLFGVLAQSLGFDAPAVCSCVQALRARI